MMIVVLSVRLQLRFYTNVAAGEYSEPVDCFAYQLVFYAESKFLVKL